MDRVSALIAIHEANFNQGRDERALLALPVGSQLDVLASHARKVAVRPRLRHPQEQAHKSPRPGLSNSADQLLGLWVRRQADADARVQH
ncbi:MAG: hypothetical protein GX886_00930 [Comamonadaceae bacterium]|nr:hypothetical protein [Comamonadaceae bacterium]